MRRSSRGAVMFAFGRSVFWVICFALSALALAACSPSKIEESPPPIGDFRLGHVVVSEKGSEQAPLSRDIEPGVLTEKLEEAVKDRLGRHRGDRWYHLAISIGAYSLSGAGIPVIAAPRSGLVIEVTVWDDAAAAKLNQEPHAITVLEPTSPETVIGSGFVRTPEEQAEILAISTADLIEIWLRSPESPLPGVGGAGEPE